MLTDSLRTKVARSGPSRPADEWARWYATLPRWGRSCAGTGITRDDVRHARSDPDLFVAAIERLNVPMETAIEGGDSIRDTLTARDTGGRGTSGRCPVAAARKSLRVRVACVSTMIPPTSMSRPADGDGGLLASTKPSAPADDRSRMSLRIADFVPWQRTRPKT
jgi:hypothetical protein